VEKASRPVEILLQSKTKAGEMITYYCPNCWHMLSGDENTCSVCGYDLADFNRLSFEEKLLLATNHPVQENRLMAIQILGNLGSKAALPTFEKLMETEDADVFTLREIMVALGKIHDPHSLELLRKAKTHNYAIVRRSADLMLEKLSERNKTTLIVVRHGQTDWNRSERFRGRADIPLNETGLAQAEATGARVASEWIPAAIYSSPLERARTTADSIASHLASKRQIELPVLITTGLADMDFGHWEGMTPEEAREHWPEEIDIWYNHPEQARIPGGETLEELRSRAMNTVHELAGRHPGQAIVLVSHTDVNRLILLDALDLGSDHFWRLRQDTCAINVLELENRIFTVVSMNDTCHLRGVN
jgi:broad specificity phosphatase PhoE